MRRRIVAAGLTGCAAAFALLSVVGVMSDNDAPATEPEGPAAYVAYALLLAANPDEFFPTPIPAPTGPRRTVA